jgi:hypothetical protein
MRNEFAKEEIGTSLFSGRKSQAGNCWLRYVNRGMSGTISQTGETHGSYHQGR